MDAVKPLQSYVPFTIELTIHDVANQAASKGKDYCSHHNRSESIQIKMRRSIEGQRIVNKQIKKDEI